MLVYYSDYGQWFESPFGMEYEDHGMSIEISHNINLSGWFTLGENNEKDINYKGETEVMFLYPCYSHKDGAILDGYTKENKIYFVIKSTNPNCEDGVSVQNKTYKKSEVLLETQSGEKEISEKLEEKYQRTIHALTLILAKKTKNLLSRTDKEVTSNNINASAVEKLIEEHCQTISEPRKVISNALKVPFNNPKVKNK